MMLNVDGLVRLGAVLTLTVLAGIEWQSSQRLRAGAKDVRAAEAGDRDAERRLGAWLDHETRYPLWVSVARAWAMLAVKVAVFGLAIRTLVQPAWITGGQ